MEKQLSVAKALNQLYREEHGNKDMDELRMHKLMYFVQRESLIRNDQALFRGQFEGWKYGPVLPPVRSEMRKAQKFEDVENVSDESLEIIRDVYEKYKEIPSGKLNRLTHQEFSWQNSRTGLNAEDSSDTKISLAEIRIDAIKEKINRALEGEKNE